MFHIGEDYEKTFAKHYQSSEAKVLFEKAKKLKDAERNAFLQKHNKLKRRRFLAVVIVICFVVLLGIEQSKSAIEFIPNLMERPWLGILAVGIAFFAIVRATRRSKANLKTLADQDCFKGEYAAFYTNQILPWLVKPLNIYGLKLVLKVEARGGRERAINRYRRNRNLPKVGGNRLKSIRYNTSDTKVISSVEFVNDDSRSAIKGFIWRTQFKVANPLPYDIRIKNTEGFARQGIKATANMLKSDTHKFEFNSTEMAKMFNCYISLSRNRDTQNTFDSAVESNRVLGFVAGTMAKQAQKHISDIRADSAFDELPPEKREFMKSFVEAGVGNSTEKTREKMENHIHNAHIKITPMLEEILLFIRHKYGPYHLSVGETLQIDIAKEQNLANKFNVKQEELRPEKTIDLFKPTLLDDSDISYERMLVIYEVFLLGFLLDRHFSGKE